MKRQAVIGGAVAGLLAVVLVVPVAGAGNAALMAQARHRAFLMNEAVLSQLDVIDQNATILLRGRVKQLPNGEWQVVVDDLQLHKAVEPGTFPFGHGPGGEYIRYMPFEEMAREAPAAQPRAQPQIQAQPQQPQR